MVARLHKRYGDLYCDDDVFLSATHTHSGPGAYSHYTLYNLTTFGYSPQNFEAVVDGIVQAIVRAHEDVGPARLRIAEGDLTDASINRSLAAYLANPESERARYPDDTDQRMTVLRIDRPDGTGVGVIAWFGVHATSMGNKNHLISADNKGYASLQFERWKGTDYASPHTFVAAFAQATEGDSSPNILGGEDGGGEDDYESTAISGGKQYAKARELYEAAAEEVTGPVDSRLAYVKFDAEHVLPEFADGVAHDTCVAAIGTSMIAGAEDGPGYGSEGMSCDDLSGLLTGLACDATTTECQAEKPIALETGSRKPNPWTPNILPLHVLRIGGLSLVGLPFETTTMAARRIRDTVLPPLQPAGVSRLVVASPVNAFAGYMTTREEYATQNYEGASTHFGPWQLSSVRQNLLWLAQAMAAGLAVLPGPTPPDLSAAQTITTVGIAYDDKLLKDEWGQVLADAPGAVDRGATMSVTFRGAHPNNDLRTQDTYLKVERRDGEAWVTVANDWDWETRYLWVRDNCFPTFGCSKVTIEWEVPADAAPGTYRIRTFGAWKDGLDGKVRPYEGTSREFAVQ